VIDMNVRTIAQRLPKPDEVTADRIDRARAWTNLVGWRYPLPAFEDELFGARGLLRDSSDDEDLRRRFRKHHADAQPRVDEGEQLALEQTRDEEQCERAAIAQRARDEFRQMQRGRA
jgi:hypothetical protein